MTTTINENLVKVADYQLGNNLPEPTNAFLPVVQHNREDEGRQKLYLKLINLLDFLAKKTRFWSLIPEIKPYSFYSLLEDFSLNHDGFCH